MFQRHRVILERGMMIGLAGVAGIARLGEQGRIGQLGNVRLRLAALQRHVSLGGQPAAIEQNQQQRRHAHPQNPTRKDGTASSSVQRLIHK